MRIALFSDIHSNLHALEAVLADSKKQLCSHYICLGDIVGYNAFPKECLHIVQQLNCPTVKGNHDEEVAFWPGSHRFTPDAETAIDWTRDQLSLEDKTWLYELPYDQSIHDFTIVHATLDQPETWHYLTTPEDAAACLNNQATSICFIGHTHIPKIFVDPNKLLPDPVELQSAEPLQLKSEKRYIINVGSVGQPRDKDWRSSYCIYDTDRAEVIFRRIEYDLEAAQQAILNAGLPPTLSTRLAKGQ